jgi:hypothetical protein
MVSELSRLGRPKGALGKSKLDGKDQAIEPLLDKEVPKAPIARIVEVARDLPTSRQVDMRPARTTTA